MPDEIRPIRRVVTGNDALKQAFAMERPVVVDVVTDLYAIAKKPWAPSGAMDFHSFQRGRSCALSRDEMLL